MKESLNQNLQNQLIISSLSMLLLTNCSKLAEIKIYLYSKGIEAPKFTIDSSKNYDMDRDFESCDLSEFDLEIIKNPTDNNVLTSPFYYFKNSVYSTTYTSNDEIIYIDKRQVLKSPSENIFTFSNGIKKLFLNQYSTIITRDNISDASLYIYISRRFNFSEIAIAPEKDFIILTEEIKYEDLIFEDEDPLDPNANIVVYLKTTGKQSYKNTTLLKITKSPGLIANIGDINPGFFKYGRIFNPNRGIFCGDTKFKKNNPFKILANDAIKISTSVSIKYPAVGNVYNPTKIENTSNEEILLKELFGETIKNEYVLTDNSENSSENLTIDENYLPLYVDLETFPTYDYIAYYLESDSSHEKLVSVEFDNRGEDQTSLPCTHSFNYGNYIIHANENLNCNFYLGKSSSLETFNIYFYPNGYNKTYYQYSTYLHLYLSREGATVNHIDIDKLKFYLTDNIKFSDLTFVYSDYYWHIHIKDSFENDIAILKVLDNAGVEEFIKDPDNYDQSPLPIYSMDDLVKY